MSESMHGGRRPDDTMTAAQQVALAAVKQGRKVEDAAGEAGVSRMTVYRWIKADPVFRAAYNGWEEAARQAARARLVTMLDRSLDKVMSCVESDSRLAFKVVAAMGVFAAGGTLQTDPDRVRQEMKLEELENDCQIKRRLNRLSRGRTQVTRSVSAITPGPEWQDAGALGWPDDDAPTAPDGLPQDAETVESAPAQAEPVALPEQELAHGTTSPALMLIDILISSLEAKGGEKEAPAPAQIDAPPAQVVVPVGITPTESSAGESIAVGDIPAAVQEVAASPAAVASIEQPTADSAPAQASTPNQPLAPAPESILPNTAQCYKKRNVTLDNPDLDPRSPWCEASYNVY